MTVADPHLTSTTVDMAHAYADLGWRVIPIPRGHKYPQGIGQWQDKATTDHDTIDAWWRDGIYKTAGIGIATGAESGIWALDIDVADGKKGADSFRALTDAYGPMPATTRARTGSGGYHLIFKWDHRYDVHNIQDEKDDENSRLGLHLDVRGTGGQIIAAPSVHANGQQYRWELDPWTQPPAEAPGYLYVLLDRTPAPKPPADAFTDALNKPDSRHDDGDSIAEWANRHYDLAELLTKDRWVEMPRRPGYWVRPDKNPRDGHSAVLHDGQVLVVFTSSMPELTRHGKAIDKNVGWAFNTFGYLAATRYGGDRPACARALREEHRRLHPAPTRAQALEHRIEPGFWDARPYLTHIRTAAHARYLPADAVLGAVLTRVSYLTPPQLLLPAIVGSHGSLDVIHAIVGPSGMGKTQAMRAARDLLPSQPGDQRDGLPIGSGEGVIEAYYGMIEMEDDHGKKVKERAQVHTAVLFEVDEGQVLGDLGQRSGSTLFTNLRSAWSGGNVGQTNASADRTRLLKAGLYRFAMVVGIQPEKADELLSDAAGGTPQRFAWFTATDPTAPADPPTWPGHLDWRPPARPRSTDTWQMAVHPAIATEIRAARHQLLTTGRADVESHAYLLRLKLAALLAILDRRPDINTEDWELAATIHATSCAVRDTMTAAIADERAEKRAARVAAVAAESLGVEEALEARAVLSMAGSIARKVWRDGGMKRGEAGRACDSKHKSTGSVDDAIDHAAGEGWIRVENGAITPGPTKPPPSRRVAK